MLLVAVFDVEVSTTRDVGSQMDFEDVWVPTVLVVGAAEPDTVKEDNVGC